MIQWNSAIDFFYLVLTIFDKDLNELWRRSYRKEEKNSRDRIFIEKIVSLTFYEKDHHSNILECIVLMICSASYGLWRSLICFIFVNIIVRENGEVRRRRENQIMSEEGVRRRTHERGEGKRERYESLLDFISFVTIEIQNDKIFFIWYWL